MAVPFNDRNMRRIILAIARANLKQIYREKYGTWGLAEWCKHNEQKATKSRNA